MLKKTLVAGLVAMSALSPMALAASSAEPAVDFNPKSETTAMYDNLRVASFPTSSAYAVGGKLKKGDYVDIVATLNADMLGTNTPITRTIIQQAEVLDTNGYGDDITSVTLALTLEQVEILQHAYTVGEISYVLAPKDAKLVRTTGMINKWLCDKYGFVCVQKSE